MNTDKKRIRESFSVTLNSAQTTSYDTYGGSKYNAKFYVNLKGICDEGLRKAKAWDVTFNFTSVQSANLSSAQICVVNANFGTSNQSNTYDNSLGDGILGHLRMIAGTLNTSHLFKSNPQDNEPLRIGSVNNLNNINITVLVASTSTYSTYTDAANPDYLITLFFK